MGAERLRELLNSSKQETTTVRLAVFSVEPSQSALALAQELVDTVNTKQLISLNETAQSDLTQELRLALHTQTAEFPNPNNRLHIVFAHT